MAHLDEMERTWALMRRNKVLAWWLRRHGGQAGYQDAGGGGYLKALQRGNGDPMFWGTVLSALRAEVEG